MEHHQDRDLAARAEWIEAEAWADHQTAAPETLRSQFGISVRRYGRGVALLATRGRILGLNRTLGLGFDAPLTIELLDDVIAGYRSAGIARFLLQWSPLASPTEAPEWFAARGFRPVSRMAKLWREPHTAPMATTDLRIEQIGPEHAELYGATLAAGHGDQPALAAGHSATIGRAGWRHYLAFDGQRAVAGAALFARDGVGWCGFSATLAGHRRRGAHGALLAQRTRDAASLGCTEVVCETAEPTAQRPNQAYENMRRSGFQLLYYRPNYVIPESGA